MDLLNSLTVVTISYGVSKHHRAHHKHNLCQLCFSEVRERKWLTKNDAWNSLWIFIVFAEMLAVYEHVIMPSSSIFWNTAAKSQEWTWVGRGWIVTGPWAPTAAANGISKRPLWSFSSGSVLRSECGLYEGAWKPLWASSHPASWASTAHSSHILCPGVLLPLPQVLFSQDTFRSQASLPGLEEILVMLSRHCLSFHFNPHYSHDISADAWLPISQNESCKASITPQGLEPRI